jgi:hypothetical protein
MTLALAALLATGTSGKLGVDGLYVRHDRHMRGGAGGEQAEVRTELAPGAIELGGGELPVDLLVSHRLPLAQE